MNPIGDSVIKEIIDSLENALIEDVKNKTIRRIILQDFIMGLQRRNLIPREVVSVWIEYGLKRLSD